MPDPNAPSRGRRNNPRGQGSRLREDLIDAAAQLVAESGDAGTLSMRQVTSLVGVAATSVYLHFADLNELKLAVARKGLADFRQQRQAAVASAGTAPDALLAGCLAYIQFALENPGRYRLMFSGTLDRTLEAWGDHDGNVNQDRAAYNGLVSAIGRCQEEDAAPKNADPEYLAALLWPALHGIALLRIDRPELPLPPVDQVVSDTVRRLIQLRQ